MVKIDDVDREILRILRKDGRASYSDIAKRVSLSPATVRRRVERMLEENVIERFTTVVNAEKAGKGIVALVTITPTRIRLAKIFDLVNRLPEVDEAYFTAGKCGIIMRVAHPSIALLSRFVEDLQNRRDIISVECCVLLKKLK